jgi:putative ABC transport system permease protein
VLVGIVALSLLVGGIVIMNIMLMVRQRTTREIGLRKALGAKRRDIMSQVLTESITLSTFGGLVGIPPRVHAGDDLAAVTPLPATLEIWSILLASALRRPSACSSAPTPAARAAALDPIEALRRE